MNFNHDHPSIFVLGARPILDLRLGLSPTLPPNHDIFGAQDELSLSAAMGGDSTTYWDLGSTPLDLYYTYKYYTYIYIYGNYI